MPGPPPGAAVPVDVAVCVACLAVDGVAIGEVAETGDVAAAGAGFFALNHECLAGVGDVAAGDAVVPTVASGFLECLRFATVGDAAGLEMGAAVGDAVVATVASFFLECLCLAAAGDASGLEAGVGVGAVNAAAENPANTINRQKNLFMICYNSERHGFNATPKIVLNATFALRGCCAVRIRAGYGRKFPARERTMELSPLLTRPSVLTSERKFVPSATWPERLRA